MWTRTKTRSDGTEKDCGFWTLCGCNSRACERRQHSGILVKTLPPPPCKEAGKQGMQASQLTELARRDDSPSERDSEEVHDRVRKVEGAPLEDPVEEAKHHNRCPAKEGQRRLVAITRAAMKISKRSNNGCRSLFSFRSNFLGPYTNCADPSRELSMVRRQS